MDYELHPLCTLFPRLPDAEFSALVADIRENGLRQPIVLHEGMILDGGNRYRACVAAGVTPTYTTFAGGNLVSFVLSANLHRRHMTPGQQAAIVASAQDWAKAQTVGRPEKGKAVDHLDTVEQRAAAAGTSRVTQMKADKVAKARPDLARKVAHGEISLPKAVERVDAESGKPAPAPKKPALAPSAAPAPSVQPIVAPTGDVLTGYELDGDPLQLLSELQKENEDLTKQIAILTAEDTKAELHKMILQRDHHMRQQSEAMDRAHESRKREKQTMTRLMRCGKAVGEEDPSKIPAAVEALARQLKQAA